MLNRLILEINSFANKKNAENYKRFFKTEKEGDIFVGVKALEQKRISKKYSNLPFPKIKFLLDSKIHEYKIIAERILIERYKLNPEEIFNFCMQNSKKFNNWDLVDLISAKIFGNFLLNRNRGILYKFAKSNNLWERRIAIVSTLEFIRNNQFGDALKILEILIFDKHHLINKASGWVLREIGKKDKSILKDFLKTNYNKIPRVTLRYAIEKFSKEERKKWLIGKF